MRFKADFLTIITALMITGTSLQADDWPQWMGPHRDAIWRETGIVDRFPEAGLPVRWRVPVAGGYSGPAVAGGRVYLTDFVRESGQLANNPDGRNELQGTERVLCLDAQSGQQIWMQQYQRPYQISYAAGPRATPTVDDGKVYTLGAEGDLYCWDAESGKRIWHKHLPSEYQMETPVWGFCGHPLVERDLLFCVVGGTNSVAVAFEKETGHEVWRALSASEPGYCPPTMIEVDGVRQLLIWHADAVNGLNPQTGEVLWSQPLKPSYGMSIAAPRLSGNLLYVSGIGPVGCLYKLSSSPPGAEVVWHGDMNTRGLFCSNATPFIQEGTLYGVGVRKGELAAIELETGKRLWESFALTPGNRPANSATAFIIQHQDKYFLFNEMGDLILARLTPEKYQEISRFHILEPTNEAFGRQVVWSHPAFANQAVYARNDRELVCVSLATTP